MQIQPATFYTSQASEDALIILVNEHDEVIGAKPRNAVELGDMYRGSGLFITNHKGQVLLARRSETKRHNPGTWSVSAGGTLEVGETYESNMIKETQEEIGLTITNFNKAAYLKLELDTVIFVQLFTATINSNDLVLTLQESEVAEAGWWEIAEIRRALREEPDQFSVGFSTYFNAVF